MFALKVYLSALIMFATAFAADRHVLEYAPAPADNPLKGLVPYAEEGGSSFPHSLEFHELALAGIVKGPAEYDWQTLEKILNDIAARGHQAIIRVFLEYPDRKKCIPPFLIEHGLKVVVWKNTDSSPPGECETPDYENAELRKTLQDFVRELGKKYDGDPRLGYLTAGLLGLWGEWHDYPREKLFASKTVQAEVMDAYAAAFKITPVLLRYPAGDDDEAHASNVHRNFGYHDDSFAWATLETGKKNDDWFFMAAMRNSGAMDKWKTCPIGGEIRPEAWGKVFDENPGNNKIQSFEKCVAATHATWLMDSGMFKKNVPEERKKRAIEQVRKMGYEFSVQASSCEILREKLSVKIEVLNKGVAPIYYDWKPELALLNSERKIIRSAIGVGSLAKLLPEDPARVWDENLDAKDLPAGKYKLLVRIPNSLPNGKPLRFANSTQDKDLDGWLTLGPLEIR